jgi:hypothetical protein
MLWLQTQLIYHHQAVELVLEKEPEQEYKHLWLIQRRTMLSALGREL